MEPLESADSQELAEAKAYVARAFSLDASPSGTLSLPDSAAILTYRFFQTGGKEEDLALVMQFSRNMLGLHPRGFIAWVSDMIRYYDKARSVCGFTYSSGPAHLGSLIRGLPSLRRRFPNLTEKQELLVLVGSMVLLANSRQRRTTKYFYEGSEGEMTLRDKGLVDAFIGARIVDPVRFAAILTMTVADSGDQLVRPAEVEAALSASQAAALRKGAL